MCVCVYIFMSFNILLFLSFIFYFWLSITKNFYSIYLRLVNFFHMYLFHPLFSYIYKHIAQVGLDQNNQKEKNLLNATSHKIVRCSIVIVSSFLGIVWLLFILCDFWIVLEFKKKIARSVGRTQTVLTDIETGSSEKS